MHPLSPFLPPAAAGRRRPSRGWAALLAAAALAASLAAAGAQPPKDKEPTKEPEPKWPEDINGKDLKATMKDMEDPDPTVREFAARVLPNFGPPAQKGDVSKLLLRRMNQEKDPGVRFAVWQAVGSIAFESEADNREAVRLLAQVVDSGASGGASRYQAVQTLSMFGPKAEGAITALTGVALRDAAYETRRQIAATLGRAGFNELTGPNTKAQRALANILAKDESAAVRMEALQALVLMGPPWAEVRKPGDTKVPAVNTKDAGEIVQYLKYRVGDPKQKLPAVEKDRQVEVWARLAMMRFDPKEINEDNLEALARHLTGADTGVKIQALQAIAYMGALGARKLDAVVQCLWEKDQPLTLTVATVQVLEAMGGAAKPALPELKRFVAETRKDTEKIGAGKPAEKMTAEELQRRKNGEDLAKLVEKAVKTIEEAKAVVGIDEPAKKP